MKAGDLVELSTYGKNCALNRQDAEGRAEPVDSYGIVLGPNPGRAGTWHVRWNGRCHLDNIALRYRAWYRRELKYVKKTLNELGGSPSKLGEEARK